MNQRTAVETEQILRFEEQIREANLRRDRDMIGPLLADDFIFTSGRGRWGKEQWLANVVRWQIQRLDFEDVEYRSRGAVVVFLARVVLDATLDGQDRSGQLYVTDIWANEAGRWQMLSRQWTPAPERPT